ncbi:alkyl sulfatase C-terminal domain-containing protein [Photobacterium sp. 2_MG-2023]|uniref:alkyl sulfatase C-terminal domain-containing protein n=1 Tax=Photobacterium sp. 2_MG-2023 TaxID=3062663 RepID=UPI0026E2AFC2|nr:alkyl sulfatase C-terminal domain-containing protein [Photobacterium sp. 2_MG-2023]MDO6581542.1 alkyl sulfatase C-terminal domain-containing protein [Photobacterium sp. 2_MG-2023]
MFLQRGDEYATGFAQRVDCGSGPAFLPNAEKAEGKKLTLNFVFPDRDERYLLELENSHLNNIKGQQSDNADVTITINRSDMDNMLIKQQSFQQLLQDGKVTTQGNVQAFGQLMGMMDEFPFWFKIATP